MTGVLCVAAGGALGAALRYLCTLIPIKCDFPIITLCVNFIGSFAIGFIVGFAAEKKADENLILFLKVGLCGGFTTFSTFSLEVLNLFEQKNYICGGIYAGLSFALCVIGVMLGKTASRHFFA